MKIQIFRVDAGWIMGEIRSGEDTIFFDYSFLTDFLKDLMRGLLYVGGYLEQDLYLDEFTAEWEPAVDDWKLDLQKDLLHIRITRYEDSDRKQFSEEQCVICDYCEFLRCFTEGMADMLKKTGLYGYQTEWGSEFPLSLFLKIADISMGKNAIELKKIGSEENFGVETEVSDYKKEIHLWNQLMGGSKNKM